MAGYHTYKHKAHHKGKRHHKGMKGEGFFDDFAHGFSQGLEGVAKIGVPLVNFASKFAGYDDGDMGGNALYGSYDGGNVLYGSYDGAGGPRKTHVTKTGREYHIVNGHRRYLDSKAGLRASIASDARKLAMPTRKLTLKKHPTAHESGKIPKSLKEYHAFRKMAKMEHPNATRDEINAMWHKHNGSVPKPKKGGSIITDLIGSFL